MRPRGAGAVLALLAALATACTGASGAERPYGTGPDGEHLDKPDPAVEQAYLGYWDAWLKAYRTPGAPEDGLARYSDEPNLSSIRATLADSYRKKQYNEGTVDHRLAGMRTEGDSRIVYDCADLSGWLIHDAATGAEIEQVRHTSRQMAVMTLRRIDGSWKVTNSRKPLECTVQDRAK
ncbi:hypothetical protein PUR71_39195 [Streptomyces sp. SP17BM10]|uniref:hypothetical protein n=1 Tax=Streptomyces sp. SP17BM10 TaxID=3002530 RepID=UPI002E79225C|nr:hypothetical protein [Streptomyces sp. SP17BM10]MEE1788886.1 hypothetical protein [Streptomyces sp. SP17BM10]